MVRYFDLPTHTIVHDNHVYPIVTTFLSVVGYHVVRRII